MALDRHEPGACRREHSGGAPEQAVLICYHVYTGERPVLLAYREEDILCWLCGQSDHEESGDEYRIAGAQHLIAEDESLRQVVAMPVGFEAERADPSSDWVVRMSSPQ